MSLLYVLKPQKDRVLRSIITVLLDAGVTPNVVTAAGLGARKREAAVGGQSGIYIRG